MPQDERCKHGVWLTLEICSKCTLDKVGQQLAELGEDMAELRTRITGEPDADKKDS